MPVVNKIAFSYVITLNDLNNCRLFLDSSEKSLKCVLNHNMSIGHSARAEET